ATKKMPNPSTTQNATNRPTGSIRAGTLSCAEGRWEAAERLLRGPDRGRSPSPPRGEAHHRRGDRPEFIRIGVGVGFGAGVTCPVTGFLLFGDPAAHLLVEQREALDPGEHLVGRGDRADPVDAPSDRPPPGRNLFQPPSRALRRLGP